MSARDYAVRSVRPQLSFLPSLMTIFDMVVITTPWISAANNQITINSFTASPISRLLIFGSSFLSHDDIAANKSFLPSDSVTYANSTLI